MSSSAEEMRKFITVPKKKYVNICWLVAVYNYNLYTFGGILIPRGQRSGFTGCSLQKNAPKNPSAILDYKN